MLRIWLGMCIAWRTRVPEMDFDPALIKGGNHVGTAVGFFGSNAHG